MFGLDVHSSLVAGLFLLILAGMIKNAVDVHGLKTRLETVCKRLDDGAVQMRRQKRRLYREREIRRRRRAQA